MYRYIRYAKECDWKSISIILYKIAFSLFFLFFLTWDQADLDWHFLFIAEYYAMIETNNKNEEKKKNMRS